jgi:hypothetical protein
MNEFSTCLKSLFHPVFVTFNFAVVFVAVRIEKDFGELYVRPVKKPFDSCQYCFKLLSYARHRPSEKCSLDLNEALSRTLALLEYDLRKDNIDV